MERKSKYRACSCYGSNENCMHCSGTGLLELMDVDYKTLEEKDIGDVTCKSDKSVKEIKNVVFCPNCKIPLLEKDLDWHINTKHGKWKRVYLIEHGDRVKCPYCNKKCRNINEHIAKNHKHHLTQHPTSKTRLTVKCEKCNVVVRKDRIEKHMLNVHKIGNLNKNSAIRNKTDETVVDLGQSVSYISPQTESKLEKQLDYTKPYAHSYREHGKFGSHPSHDNFEDDSEP